jgi:hypothetical protein
MTIAIASAHTASNNAFEYILYIPVSLGLSAQSGDSKIPDPREITGI